MTSLGKLLAGSLASLSIVAAGCGSSSSSTRGTPTKPTAQTTPTTAASPTRPTKPAAPPSNGANVAGISPPPGSKQLSLSNANGTMRARYSSSRSPASIASSYKNQLKSQGWTIVSFNGGGGGSGSNAGGGYDLKATKSGATYSLQVGGGGGYTFFEVCGGSQCH